MAGAAWVAQRVVRVKWFAEWTVAPDSEPNLRRGSGRRREGSCFPRCQKRELDTRPLIDAEAKRSLSVRPTESIFPGW